MFSTYKHKIIFYRLGGTGAAKSDLAEKEVTKEPKHIAK